MKLSAALGALLVVATSLAVAAMQLAAASGGGQYLVPGYYSTKNCSSAEDIVREEVSKAIMDNRGNGAGLIRLYFHDCWVHGCDGSVLLNASALNPDPEKNAASSIGLRGFDVIKTIKDRLESMCPGVVSCADILAFAARDATGYLSRGQIYYDVPSGHQDGVVSSANDALAALPGPTSSFDELEKNFRDKNFTVEELVALSGAHSIGVAHYTSFQDRLTANQSEIDVNYQYALRVATKYRSVVAVNIRDETFSFKMRARYYPALPSIRMGDLDNSYYRNALDKRVLFKSDWALTTNDTALDKLKEYKYNPRQWNWAFAAAMQKLSKLRAEGNHFEIRKECSATNKHSY